MAGKSYLAQNRELSYRVWRECGQNIELTLRTLKEKHGLPVTKPTIYGWIEKYNWKDRAARAENEERKATDAVVSDEARMVLDLEKQKTKYERYFDSLGEAATDTQAMYAYTNLVKTIIDVKTRIGAYKAGLFLDFMRDLIDWLSKNDPEAVPVLERDFDDFIAFARKKYGGG